MADVLADGNPSTRPDRARAATAAGRIGSDGKSSGPDHSLDVLAETNDHPPLDDTL